MSYSVLIEDIIKDTGGCGRFQWALTTLVQLSKTIATWTMFHMMFNGQEPDFFCTDNVVYRNVSVPDTVYNISAKRCRTNIGTDCHNFQYDGTMRTIVSEVSSVSS